MMHARALVITVASIHAVEADFTITHLQSGKCLERGDGTNIEVRTCDGQPQQMWKWMNGALMNHFGFTCIDIDAGPGYEGYMTQMQSCNISQVNQHWEIPHDGTPLIMNPNSGLCMSVDETDVNAGHHVLLLPCNASDVNARWMLNGLAPEGEFALKNPHSGQCLDIASEGWVDGNAIDVKPCDGQPWQAWTWSNGALMNPHSGKCIDIDVGWEYATSPLLLWTCNSSQVNQHWGTPHDGTPFINPNSGHWETPHDGTPPFIINPNSGMCMGIAESGVNAGHHHVQLWYCNETDVNVRWSQDGIVEAITSDSVDQPHDETRMVMV
jgi:hypothetical protein